MTFQRLGRILVLRVGGQEIRTTAEHPFWVWGKGWTASAALQVGDHVGDQARAVASAPWGRVD